MIGLDKIAKAGVENWLAMSFLLDGHAAFEVQQQSRYAGVGCQLLLTPAKRAYMRTIGNVLWLILGGSFMGLGWWLAGLLCAITVVGIPNQQCSNSPSVAPSKH